MWDGIRNHKIEANKASAPGEVTSYQLSPEELEKYRSNTVSKKVESKPLNLHLQKKPIVKEMDGVQKEMLTKSLYLELKSQGKNNKEIMKQFGLNNVKFYKLKNDSGLVHTEPRQQVIKEKEVVEEVTAIQELKQEIDKLKAKENEINIPVTYEVPEEKIVVAETKTIETKPCQCKIQLQEQILSLKSDLALQKKRNEELMQSIDAFKKYRSLYFSTVEALKVHFAIGVINININDIEQAIRNYHWMVNEIIRLKEELKTIDQSNTSKYGIDATMPRASNTSDSVYNIVAKRDRSYRTLKKFEAKVKFINDNIVFIKDDLEITILNCLLDGMNISGIAHHLKLSERKVYGIKDDIVKRMAKNAGNAGNAENAENASYAIK